MIMPGSAVKAATPLYTSGCKKVLGVAGAVRYWEWDLKGWALLWAKRNLPSCPWCRAFVLFTINSCWVKHSTRALLVDVIPQSEEETECLFRISSQLWLGAGAEK